MTFLGLNKADIQNLEYEIISDETRLKLTRLIRSQSRAEDENFQIFKQNRFVNIANINLGKKIYLLFPDDSGDYPVQEHAWHNGEIELIMRRPDTIKLVETLSDMLQENLLDCSTVNEILSEDGCSVSFEKIGVDNLIKVQILEIGKLEEAEQDNHPNIRLLVNRMDTALSNSDYSAVLHASASVLETLAKLVVGKSTVENQPLGSFFDRYRKDSSLPSPLIDYVLEIYNKRNVVSTAGHGGTVPPEITSKEAVILAEMAKTFVRIERRISRESMSKTQLL